MACRITASAEGYLSTCTVFFIVKVKKTLDCCDLDATLHLQCKIFYQRTEKVEYYILLLKFYLPLGHVTCHEITSHWPVLISTPAFRQYD